MGIYSELFIGRFARGEKWGRNGEKKGTGGRLDANMDTSPKNSELNGLDENSLFSEDENRKTETKDSNVSDSIHFVLIR